MAWEHRGCPPGRWPGALGTRGRFQSRSRTQSPQPWRPPRPWVPSFVKRGWGQDPLQGTRVISTMSVTGLTHLVPVMETGASSWARAGGKRPCGVGDARPRGRIRGAHSGGGRACPGAHLSPTSSASPCSRRVPLCPSQPQEREDGELVVLPQEGEDVPVLHPASGEGAELLLGGAVRGGPEHAVRGHGALQPAPAAHHGAVYVAGPGPAPAPTPAPAPPPPTSSEPLPVHNLLLWDALGRTPVLTKVLQGPLLGAWLCPRPGLPIPGLPSNLGPASRMDGLDPHPSG